MGRKRGATPAIPTHNARARTGNVVNLHHECVIYQTLYVSGTSQYVVWGVVDT